MSLVEYRRKRRFDQTKEPDRARRCQANAPFSWCSCIMPAAGTTTSACRWVMR
jgi:hypothetical protein